MRRLASDCCKPPHHRSRHSLPRSIRSSSPRLHAAKRGRKTDRRDARFPARLNTDVSVDRRQEKTRATHQDSTCRTSQSMQSAQKKQQEKAANISLEHERRNLERRQREVTDPRRNWRHSNRSSPWPKAKRTARRQRRRWPGQKRPATVD